MSTKLMSTKFKMTLLGVCLLLIASILYFGSGVVESGPAGKAPSIASASKHDDDDSVNKTYLDGQHVSNPSNQTPSVAQKNQNFESYTAVSGSLRQLANKEHYSRKMSLVSANGERTENISYYRREADGSYTMRNDILFYLPNQTTPDSHRNHHEIVNSEGYWELYNYDSVNEVAFLRTDDGEPTVITERNVLLRDAQKDYDPNIKYSRTEGRFSDVAATLITAFDPASPSKKTEYAIDSKTSDLLAVTEYYAGTRFTMTFDSTAPLLPEVFEIPRGRIVMPSKDINDDLTMFSVKSNKPQ